MPWHCECLCLGARAARAPSPQPAGAGAGSGSQPAELTSKQPIAEERAADLSLTSVPGGDDADAFDEVRSAPQDARARRAFLYVHTYLSQGQMTTTHHLLVLTRPNTQVPLVHHTNPPHPVAQPLPPSTEDTPSHRAIIPSLTEHRSVRMSEGNGRRMAGATGLCAWPCRVCSPPPPPPSSAPDGPPSAPNIVLARPRRKPTLQIASMGTKVANVQHMPHCVEPEGLHWLKVPGIIEPQLTQPPPLPPRPPPYVHPSGEIHGLQVDDEAGKINGLQVDDEAVARTSRPRRGSESAEGADIGGSQPTAKTKPSGTEPDVNITKVTNSLAHILTRVFKNDATILIRNCSSLRSHAHKKKNLSPYTLTF